MDKEKSNNGLYFVKLNWYDDFEDENKTVCAFVLASSYAKACKKVSDDFQYINKVEIEEITSTYTNINCIYVPNDDELIKRIKEENDF